MLRINKIRQCFFKERVVGLYTDQISHISKFIPGNEEESRHMLFIFKQYYSQIIATNEKKFSDADQNSDSDDDDDDDEEEN